MKPFRAIFRFIGDMLSMDPPEMRRAQSIDIADVKRLALMPDDVLVVKATAQHLSQDRLRQMKLAVEEYLPEGAKVLVIDQSIELAVLHPERTAA